MDKLKYRLDYNTINMEVYGEDILNLPKLTKLIMKSGLFRDEHE